MTTFELVFVFAGAAFFAFIGISMLQEKHAAEINLIWYINSFSFVLFLGLHTIAYAKGRRPAEICGSYESMCQKGYETLTDLHEEVALLMIVAALVVVPQVISYLLSGLSGSAEAPKFVRQLNSVIMWSLIKFLATLGGIETSAFVAKTITGKDPHFAQFVNGFAFTSWAFVFAGTHLAFDSSRSALRPIVFYGKKPFLHLHRFCTRNVPPEQEVKVPPCLIEINVNLPELSELTKLTDHVSVQAHLNPR